MSEHRPSPAASAAASASSSNETSLAPDRRTPEPPRPRRRDAQPPVSTVATRRSIHGTTHDSDRPNPRQPRVVFERRRWRNSSPRSGRSGCCSRSWSARRRGAKSPIRTGDGGAPVASRPTGRAGDRPGDHPRDRDDDLLRDALLENLHRAQLNPLEEAAAYQQMLEDFGCTQEERRPRIGRSRPQISNTLRLLKLPATVQRRVAAGVSAPGTRERCWGLADAASQERLAQRIVAEGISVRDGGGAGHPRRGQHRTSGGPRRIRGRLRGPIRAPSMPPAGSRIGWRLGCG